MKLPTGPRAYVITVAVVAVSGLVRWLLDPFLGDHLPFITFFIAVVVASWLGGLRTGLLAVVLSTLCALYFFIPPRGLLTAPLNVHSFGVATYLIVGLVIALFGERMQASQHRLAEQEERLRTTLASIEDGVIGTDAQGRVTTLNDVARFLTGWGSREATGQPLETVFRIVSPGEPRLLANLVTRTLQGGRDERVTQRAVVVAADGQERRIEFTASPLRTATAAAGCVITLTDLTDRNRAEQALHGSETALARELARMSRLQALSVSIAQAGDFNALLQEILAASVELTGTDKGNIQLLDPATGHLRIVVHQGLGQRLVEHFAECGWEATCEAAHRQRQRVIVEDVTQVASAQGTVELDVVLEDGIRAILSTPLVSREGRFLGMLNNHYREVHRPSANDLRYVDLLARMAADFIERSQAEQALRDADRRKDEFLAVLSHELRNPLAPMMNAMHILRIPGVDEDMRGAAIAMIERQIGQLVRLVDDLLHVSRITSGKIELQRQFLELAPVVNQAVESARATLDRQSHQFTVTLPREPVRVHADPARLHQVVGNLLNNAFKFTPPGGRVALTVESDGEAAVIRVKDDGIGIARENLARIFEMFVQVDNSLQRTQAGLGIGLCLVRELVQMHGGAVTASSDGPGCGSEFVVRLPLAAEAPDPEDPRPGTESGRRLTRESAQFL